MVGSIAWIEAGGLRVGPQSAGANPGPACYGRGGTEPTVTDANLVLGRVDSAWFAGGQMTLDSDRARAAVAGLGTRLGLGVLDMAEGICAVANAKMAQAIRTITVSRGIEPRDFALVAFGGAGPMHAAFLAWELGIREVLVPRFPGAFSAWGCCKPSCARTSPSRTSTYAQQEYTLTVPVNDHREPLQVDFLEVIAKRFADLHESRYGHSNLGAPIEFVTLRSTALGDLGRAGPAGPEPVPPGSSEVMRGDTAVFIVRVGDTDASRSTRYFEVALPDGSDSIRAEWEPSVSSPRRPEDGFAFRVIIDNDEPRPVVFKDNEIYETGFSESAVRRSDSFLNQTSTRETLDRIWIFNESDVETARSIAPRFAPNVTLVSDPTNWAGAPATRPAGSRYTCLSSPAYVSSFPTQRRLHCPEHPARDTTTEASTR